MIGEKIRPIAEEELRLPIRRLFPADRYMMRTEIPFNGKIIDVLLMDKKTHRLIAIELKIRKWKQALRQAAVHQLCANRVYVGLYRKYINESDKEFIARYGIGIIEVKRTCKKTLKAVVIQQPKRLKLMNPQYAKELRTYFLHKI